jgi:hypothetical protein
MSEFQSTLLHKKIISGVGYARFSFVGKDRLSMHGSCVVYKVEAGEMTIVIRDKASVLKKGDRVTIEPFTPYYKEGNATIFARDFPPFDPNTLVFLD